MMAGGSVGIFYLVQKGTQSRYRGLKALQNVVLVMEAPMSFDAFNNDGIFLLIAIGCCSM